MDKTIGRAKAYLAIAAAAPHPTRAQYTFGTNRWLDFFGRL
jgi:hypothetical protein